MAAVVVRGESALVGHGLAADRRADMVREHRECLSAMVCEVDQVRAQADADELGHPGLGLALVMFAGELA